MPRFLLVGVPRSGTSWTGTALGLTEGTRYVDEPDGFRDPFAFRVMMRHGENPILDPTDPAPDYERLWAGAFAGGLPARGLRGRVASRAYARAGTDARRRARAGDGTAMLLRVAGVCARPPAPDPGARQVLVKSVQCACSLDWVASRFAPRVVMLVRNPLNTLASWRDLDFVRNPRETAALARHARATWAVQAPEPDAPQLAHQAFFFGILNAALHQAIARHPDWVVARHEELCVDAPRQLRALAERLGLVWTDAAEQFVHDSDRGGEGFATNRVTRDQPDRWRERLSAAEVDVIRGVLDTFPEWTHAER